MDTTLTLEKIEDIINDKEWRRYEEGFTKLETQIILSRYDNINLDKFYNALRGTTCTMRDNNLITYPVDLRTALICGIENRDQHSWEID